MASVITIPSEVTKGEELVVVPRSLYEKFSVWEKEIEDVLKKVERGKRACEEGKTYTLKSPKQLLSK